MLIKLLIRLLTNKYSKKWVLHIESLIFLFYVYSHVLWLDKSYAQCLLDTY